MASTFINAFIESSFSLNISFITKYINIVDITLSNEEIGFIINVILLLINVKSPKNVEITNTDVKEVAVTAFAGMEAETEKLYKFWDEYTDFLGSDYSAIVQDVKVEGDDNAKQNLEFNGFVANSSSVYVLKVQKKEGITVQTETKCNITVTITDRLGLTKSAVVPVILKPTAVAGE